MAAGFKNTMTNLRLVKVLIKQQNEVDNLEDHNEEKEEDHIDFQSEK